MNAKRIAVMLMEVEWDWDGDKVVIQYNPIPMMRFTERLKVRHKITPTNNPLIYQLHSYHGDVHILELKEVPFRPWVKIVLKEGRRKAILGVLIFEHSFFKKIFKGYMRENWDEFWVIFIEKWKEKLKTLFEISEGVTPHLGEGTLDI